MIMKDNPSQEVDCIVNATGANKHVSKETMPLGLVHHMLSECILEPNMFGGVEVEVPPLSAVSAKYGVLRGLKVHGQLISGIEFGNSAVEIISGSVKEAVQDIASHFVSDEE